MWNAFVRFVLDVLAVPPEPSPPSGTPGTLKVFRAAEAYYAYRLVLFALRHVVAFAAFGGAFVVTELALHDEGAPPIAFALVRVIEFAAAGVWLIALAFGF